MKDDEKEKSVQECVQFIEVTYETQCAHIFLQVMDDISSFQTMRVISHHGKKELHLLLDSGNTNNFIDTSNALKMDCKEDL